MLRRTGVSSPPTGLGRFAAPTRTAHRTRPALPSDTQAAAASRPMARPDPELFSPPPKERLLPSRPIGDPSIDWSFVGVCGGAGTTTATRLANAALEERVADGGQAWPDPQDAETAAVVLVAPSHMAGLACARDAARQFLAGAAPRRTTLVGLLVVPDRPGRLPPALTSAQRLLEGAFPNVWTAPYVPEYRLVPDPTATTGPLDRTYLDLLTRISGAASQQPLPGPAFRHASRTAAALLVQPTLEGAVR